jgi:hypothetical protein
MNIDDEESKGKVFINYERMLESQDKKIELIAYETLNNNRKVYFNNYYELSTYNYLSSYKATHILSTKHLYIYNQSDFICLMMMYSNERGLYRFLENASSINDKRIRLYFIQRYSFDDDFIEVNYRALNHKVIYTISDIANNVQGRVDFENRVDLYFYNYLLFERRINNYKVELMSRFVPEVVAI